MSTKSDIRYMKTALLLAKRAVGNVAPNPAVGCVVVKNNQIISTGITAKGGRPHAESIALKEVDASGATLYVTLEPCCHHGKTPPCTDAIIKSGVKRVVIATTDPYREVAGRGIDILRETGIEVVLGVCEEEAKRLNAGFFSVQLKKRPYITLKLATSSDGKIAAKEGVKTKITGEDAHNYAHYLRAMNDAIMVGVNTVVTDNPELTCRLPGLFEQSPVRVVADSNLSVQNDYKLLKDADKNPLYILTTKDKKSAQLIKCDADKDGRVDLSDAMQKLAERGITRLLVEGGGKVAGSFIKTGLVDELIWIKAPNEIGNLGIPAINGFDIKDIADKNFIEFSLGDDLVIKKYINSVY